MPKCYKVFSNKVEIVLLLAKYCNYTKKFKYMWILNIGTNIISCSMNILNVIVRLQYSNWKVVLLLYQKNKKLQY